MNQAEMNELKVFIVRVRIAELVIEKKYLRALIHNTAAQIVTSIDELKIADLEKLLEEGGYE
jgi:hypothetical protein